MASGHMNRVKRPDTWLHRPMLQNVKKILANPEPSTHDPKAKWRVTRLLHPRVRASWAQTFALHVLSSVALFGSRQGDFKDRSVWMRG